MNTSTQPGAAAGIETSPDKDLDRQIFNTMLRVHGTRPGYRPVHAKGIVCQGSFAPSAGAAKLSRAAHFKSASVPVVVRFSDGSPDPSIPDSSPDAGPRGMAVRFQLPGGGTDVVALSHNGFVVGTGEEFLALQQAVVATDPGKPHPWPIEEFFGAHPVALKFVLDNRVIPASFATEAFYSNNAFIFVNETGARQAVRYQILPVAGKSALSDAEAKARPVNFLVDELKQRLATGPIQHRLVAQLPNPGDATKDSSIVWPDDRRTIELGVITVSSVAPDSIALEREMVYDPTHLTDGIELSDDPLPALRARVYSLSAAHRQKQR